MLDLNLEEIRVLLIAVNERIVKLQTLQRETLVFMGTMMDNIASLDNSVHHIMVITARRNLLVQAMQLRNKLETSRNVYNQIADTVKGVPDDYPGYREGVYRPDDSPSVERDDDDDLPF